MTKTAAIYVRVSTDEQTKGYSLTTQIDACNRYAEERGYTVLYTFSDDYTGASLDRPALNNLGEFLGKEKVSVVIVYDIDRLARRSVYQMLIEEEFRKLGTIIEYVVGQYEDTDEGRLQKQIRASIAEYEKAKILERSKRGKKGKAQSGFVLVGSRPPYGYRVKSEPHKAWLEIDEDEAKIVKLVYSWYIGKDELNKKMSIYGIQSKLIEMGIPTRGDKQQHVAKKRGTGIWSDKMIRNILKNATYTGVWYYGKTKMVSDGHESTRVSKAKRGLGKQVARSRDEWVSVPVPSIITQEEYELAQERLLKNVALCIRNTKHDYLMGRRLTCAKCGYSAVGMTRRNIGYYRCNGAWQKPKVCDVSNYHVDAVDTAVWAWICDLLGNPEKIKQGLQELQEDSLAPKKSLEDRNIIIQEQLDEAQDKLNKIIDLYLNRVFTEDVLLLKKAEIESTIHHLQSELTEISSHLHNQDVSAEQFADIEAFCKEIQSRLSGATFEEKRQLIDFLDVHGKLALENDEKVVYVKCQIGKQQLSVARTSHSPNDQLVSITITGKIILSDPPQSFITSIE